ncbi:hypothetical protein D9M73_94190 [compost metagenome]
MLKLNDRERILTRLVDLLSSTMLLCRRTDVYNPQTYKSVDGGTLAHFVYYRQPVKGDLVIGQTGRIDQWKIGFYEEDRGEVHVIRDLCTDQLCDYGNERFIPIVGLSPTDLLTGARRVLYEKVLRAFSIGDEYSYRFGGIQVQGSTATITVREVFGGIGGQPSTPFDIEIRWHPKTTVKSILAAMRKGGYGTREFSHAVVDDFGDLARAPMPHHAIATRQQEVA